MEPKPLAGAEAVLADGAVRLTRALGDLFSEETILRAIRETYDLLSRTADPDRLPALAIRFAADRLTAIAKSQGDIVTDTPEVLFVCVHNAGRSQMAAALLSYRAAGRVHVHSAGSAPVDSINPVVLEAMREFGLDLSKEFPKPLTDEAVKAADVVITMGCGDACPVYPGKRYLNWELDDPAGQPLPVVRAIRDDIDRRITALLKDLLGAD